MVAGHVDWSDIWQQSNGCLSVWYSAKTDCQRKDRCCSAGEFKIAWNNICIDIVRKATISHTQPLEVFVFPLRSRAKANLPLCQAGCVIKIVTAGLFSETISKYVATELNARMWLVLMIMIVSVTPGPVLTSLTKAHFFFAEQNPPPH